MTPASYLPGATSGWFVDNVNKHEPLTDSLPLTAAQQAVINFSPQRRHEDEQPHLPALVGVAEHLQVVVRTVPRALQQQPHTVVQDLLCRKTTRSLTSRLARCKIPRSLKNFFIFPSY